MRKRIIGFGLLLLILTFFGISGCSEDTSTSITTPNAGPFEPVGTIQGIVRDSVTEEPIANAVVSIGLATASTDESGQYVLRNIPATTDALNGSVNGSYSITVDLRKVAENTDDDAVKYPDFRYEDNVAVRYTSLNDSTPCPDPEVTGDNADVENGTNLNNCGQNATNHDTPVDGLVANADIMVGKLDANIRGVVAGCDSTGFEDESLTPVGSGYTVKLITATSSSNSSSGASGRVVATTTTDDNGVFEFNNIEAKQEFSIEATNSDSTRKDTISVTSPSDDETLILSIQESTALHVCPVDSHGPEIISISPELGSDQTPVPNADTSVDAKFSVILKFSEPIKQTAETSTETSGINNLQDRVEVVSGGNKSLTKPGGIAYKVAWNSIFDELTITFATGASSLYYVRIKDIDAILEDYANKPAQLGVCPDDTTVEAIVNNPYGITADADTNDCTVYFTTNGGIDNISPPTVTFVNESSLDEAGPTTVVILDWAPVSGAKVYNLYMRISEVWSEKKVNGPFELIDCDTTTPNVVDPCLRSDNGTGTDVVTFVENSQIKLTYDIMVRAVNSDGEESANSNIVTASDAIGPQVTGTYGARFSTAGDTTPGAMSEGYTTDSTGKVNGLVIRFTELMDESTVKKADNYTFTTGSGAIPTALTATSVRYVIDNNNPFAIIEFDQTFDVSKWTDPNAGTGPWVPVAPQTSDDIGLTISGVKDVSGNTIRGKGSTPTGNNAIAGTTGNPAER